MANITYLTTVEAAVKLKTSRQMLLRYLRNGTLQVTPRILGSKMLWIEEEIDTFLHDSIYTPTLIIKPKRKGRPTKASQLLEL